MSDFQTSYLALRSLTPSPNIGVADVHQAAVAKC